MEIPSPLVGGEAEAEKAQLSPAERVLQETNSGILAKPGWLSLEGARRADGEYIITLISISVFIVIFSLGLYLKQGSSGALKQSIVLQQRAVHLQALLDEINNDPQKAIVMMKAYLKNHPNDKHAQYLLHKLYKSTNN